jgi:hypothetical protein
MLARREWKLPREARCLSGRSYLMLDRVGNGSSVILQLYYHEKSIANTLDYALLRQKFSRLQNIFVGYRLRVNMQQSLINLIRLTANDKKTKERERVL